MGRFNFKGDVQTVTKTQLDFIEKCLKQQGFEGSDVVIERVGEAGDNYAASVKRLTITENGSTLKMIAKLALENPAVREMASMDIMFRNEHVIYSEVLPKLRELQINAGIPEIELFRSPKCYGSSDEEPNEIILLEDLNEDGYKMLDRFKALTDDCVKLVLKNLAIYHSLSFVLKHQEPDTFAAFSSKLRDIYIGPMAEREEMKMFAQQVEQSALSLLENEKYKQHIRGNVCKMMHYAKINKTADIGSKHSIIQQGDGWTNNILFKNRDDIPTSCVLIDYQLASESNPVYDLMYMLFNSTSHEQRLKSYHEFIDYYHSEMDKSLHKFGLKAAFVYPRDQLDADMKRYAKWILSISVVLSSFITRSKENASDFQEAMNSVNIEDIESQQRTMDAMMVQSEESAVLYRKRVEGVIDSLLEFGLLQKM